MLRYLLFFFLSLSVLVASGCSGEASADPNAAEAPPAAAPAADAPVAISTPARVVTLSPPATLIDVPVEFTLIPVQRVFAPDLFAVGLTGNDLVLIHGTSPTGVKPRIGGMATVEGTVRPLSELPAATAARDAAGGATVSAVYQLLLYVVNSRGLSASSAQ